MTTLLYSAKHRLSLVSSLATQRCLFLAETLQKHDLTFKFLCTNSKDVRGTSGNPERVVVRSRFSGRRVLLVSSCLNYSARSTNYQK